MALLESCIQVCTEKAPVLFVSQEIAATSTLMDVCPSTSPFSVALLLMPQGSSTDVVTALDFRVLEQRSEWPSLTRDLDQRLGSNPGARVLPLLVALAAAQEPDPGASIRLPLSGNATLEILLGSNGP
jgi:hypothetical protein